jgi:hypothetical protein
VNDQGEVRFGDGMRAELTRQLPRHVLRSRKNQRPRRPLPQWVQLIGVSIQKKKSGGSRQWKVGDPRGSSSLFPESRRKRFRLYSTYLV